MIKVLFNLEMEYHFNSLYPLYQVMEKDSDYDLWFRIGQDPKKFLGLIYMSRKKKILSKTIPKNFRITLKTRGFDLVISGDALSKPEKFGTPILVNLDHGVGIKTSRIRNIIKQKGLHYHVFLEGQYWYDYIKSQGWQDKASFYITGMPKMDPLFTPGFYNQEKLKTELGFDGAKKTVLFAPSYKPSCIDDIGEKIISLVPEFNLIIKLHPYSWKGRYAPHSHHRFFERLAKAHQEIYLIPEQDYDIYPYLELADTLISDTSSVLNEFLALGKFGVIYVLSNFKEKHSDGSDVLSIHPRDWLKDAFPHLNNPNELSENVRLALDPTHNMKKRLAEYRDYFFTGLDGISSHRVKRVIDKLMKQSS